MVLVANMRCTEVIILDKLVRSQDNNEQLSLSKNDKYMHKITNMKSQQNSSVGGQRMGMK